MLQKGDILKYSSARKLPRIFTFFLVSSLLLSSCSTRDITSESYRLGKETGSGWRELTTEIEALSEWANQSTGEKFEIPQSDKKDVCQLMWLLVGWPQFGLKNMSENRADFVDGCMVTVGS